MKVLGVRLARSIWVVPQHFLNPKGAFVRPLMHALKERYQFLRSPYDQFAQLQSPPQDGWRYEHGAYNSKNGSVQVLALAFHGDGMVVETHSSTEDGDAFVEDVIAFASKEYGMPTVEELPIRRIYVSEINVHYPKRPRFLDPKLEKLVREIHAAFGNEAISGVDTLSLQIGNDTTTAPRQLAFRIDREINTSIDANRYWSQAPLTTDKHMRLLQMIEDLG